MSWPSALSPSLRFAVKAYHAGIEGAGGAARYAMSDPNNLVLETTGIHTNKDKAEAIALSATEDAESPSACRFQESTVRPQRSEAPRYLGRKPR